MHIYAVEIFNKFGTTTGSGDAIGQRTERRTTFDAKVDVGL